MARSNTSIYAALVSNIVIAVAKFIAGGISRSSAMISEAIHSLVDCINELLLLLGIHKSNKENDKSHPFGYGRELYFWSFIVSLLIFGLGAGVSFYQGIIHLLRPAMADHLKLNFMVLGIAFISEGSSFVIAWKAFRKIRGDQPFWQAIRTSKDPTTFMVLLEDGAAVTGIMIVFICLYFGEKYQNPYLDGIASLCIGFLLSFISAVLMRESHSLLMGEGVSQESERGIIGLVKQQKTIQNVHRIFSLYEAPEEVLIVLIVSFKDGLDIDEITNAIDEIKKLIRAKYPKINYILIQPEDESRKSDGFDN